MLRRCLATALTCGFAVAGCTATERPSTTTPTTTPTATPRATPAGPVAEKPAPAREDAVAFATFVVEAWAYSLATNDASPLTGVSLGNEPCRGCKELARELAQREQEGWSVQPFEVTIHRVRTDPSRGRTTTARVRFDVPETRSYFDDGTFRNASEAHVGATFTVTIRRVRRQHHLVAFTIRGG